MIKIEGWYFLIKEKNKSHVVEKARSASRLRGSIKNQHLNCLNTGKDATG